MSLYDDLGVSADASPEEIRAAYHKLAKQSHPDHGGDANRFAKVSNAYMVLRKPEARAEYDRTGETPQPDNDLANVSALIGQHFFAALGRTEDIGRVDIIAAVRRAVNDELKAIGATIVQFENAATKLRKARRRLRHKGTADFITGAIDQQIASKKEGIATMRQEVKMRQLAQKYLETYEWRVDLTDVAPPLHEKPRWMREAEAKGLFL